MSDDCPFCQLMRSDPDGRILFENDFGAAVRDGFPVSEGHTLVIPRRHIASLFEIGIEEQTQLLGLLDKARTHIDTIHHPDAYNIGINNGVAAGQTVPHLHIHLIPRYQNDIDDPRGGVRWVLPDKAPYWLAKDE